MSAVRRFAALSVSMRVLLLVLAVLLMGQLLMLAALLFTPPPLPTVYRVSEIVAIIAARDAALSNERVSIDYATAPPRETSPFSAFYVSTLKQAFARFMSMDVKDIRLSITTSMPFPKGRAKTILEEGLASGSNLDDPLLLGNFVVALRRDGDRWLLVRVQERFPNAWQRRMMMLFLIGVLIVAPIAFLFSRHLAAPIRDFALAADALGRDPDAPALLVTGPLELRTAAIAFNQMQQRLQRYVKDRTEMLAAIAHDLRTPLTRMRFFIESLPEVPRARLADEILQTEAMIAAVLSFVRDATKAVVREQLDLLALAETVVDETVETGGNVAIAGTDPVVIKGDPAGLRRMLSNLVDNALKFGTRAQVRVYRMHHHAVIEVDDDGPGLPTDELERVFEPFYRTERSRSRETGGTGLGLAIVRTVARAHGGDAELLNLDNGLRARVRLPI